ncbi:DNA recombination protein RmuC [Sphingomonas montana]|uniref:DNA recombination protein RmuC n=1 Tax=Sphingomonas montana TaxID=1843236 RepID=UPI00096D3B9B|nr:DNA recombination protein RmuC [Sphingomonas montana]
MDGQLILLMLVALAVGVALGWLLFGRAVPALRTERDKAVERGRVAEQALAVAEERARDAGLVRQMLTEVTRERDDARQALASAEATATRVPTLEARLADAVLRVETLAAERAAFVRGEAERARAHDEQAARLGELETRLDARFGELAGKALGDAQKVFLERADARFRQSEEKSGVELKALLQPVRERLQRYEETVTKVEQDRRQEYGTLTGLIASMRDGQDAVRNEAAKLVNSLRSAPKARGRWGEQQLRNVLESCGLAEHTDFQMEVSIADGEGDGGRMRPDAVVRVPGGRALVIDAKVSLNAYQDAFGAVDDRERTLGLAAHAASMKAHVNGLGNKAYWSQFADAPDYVIMFVPGEHFLSAALEHDPTLWDFAFDKRVLLATPTNLIAIARTVSAVWRQEKLAAEAQQIGELGKEMYDRLAVAAGHLKTVGGGLSTAVNNYNKFVSSFEGRVLVTGRKFRDLNIETGAKAIEDSVPVEALPRYSEAAE